MKLDNEEQNQFSRTELLIGNDGVKKLNNSKVIVFGIGGVGSYVVEALVRAGVGQITIVDPDTVEISNLNRQIEALYSTLGKNKIDVMKERILDINPNAIVKAYKPEEINGGEINLIDENVDYVIDAIDTVTNKIKIIEKADKLNVPVISCMGTGNKMDPTKLEIKDIFKTSVCPLAKVMRKELRNRQIKKVKVLYSTEEPIIQDKHILGSISFVPSVAGLIIAGEVIKDIISM